MSSTLTSRWSELAPASTKAVAESLLASAEQMKLRLIGQMHAPKSGHTYHGHVASAPGEAPASDTGALEESIAVDPNDAGAIAFSTPPQVTVGTDSPYAQVLEFGGGRIAPRPNFAPVGDEMAGEVTQSLTVAIQAVTDSVSIK